MRQRLVEGADGVGKAHGDGGLPEEQTGFGVADSGRLDAPVTGHRFDEQAVDPIHLATNLRDRCADRIGGAQYYESIDLIDAFHPQTICAYGLNGQQLPVENGAPIRVRNERALGYKQPKYVHTIELVDSFALYQGGKGGYWEDAGDYAWYAGI